MKTKSNRGLPASGRGSALLLTTILLFVVLSLVVSLSYVTVMEQQMSSKTKSSVGSFFNADSGVEWALNKIASSSGGRIRDVFANFDPDGSTAPFSGAGYRVYLLDSEGKVIIDNPIAAVNLDDDISVVKAVRSVGTQTAGDPTQRAIEAAVAAGGGGCYTSYKKSCSGDACCVIPGFKNKGSLGHWGYFRDMGAGIYASAFVPPDSNPYYGLTIDEGEAFLCCQD